MSDYEGEGWNPVELSTTVDTIGTTSHDLVENIAPRNQTKANFDSKVEHSFRRDRRTLGPRLTRTFQPLIQNIQPRAHHGTGGRPDERTFEFLNTRQYRESFKLYQTQPDHPNEIYELVIPWRNFLKSIPSNAENTASNVARDQLERIGILSDAFLRAPDPESVKILIWGTKEQCSRAKDEIQAWEKHVRATGDRPSRKAWPKERAYDGRQEDRKRQEQWRKLDLLALQDADDHVFEYEAYLVWPENYDLDGYVTKYEATTLKEIGEEFSCRFKHEKKLRPRYTKVQALQEHDLLSAYQRLINLVKEMVAQRNRGTHGNFCRLPPPETYGEQVSIARENGAPNAPYQVILPTTEMTVEEANEWRDWMKIYEKQNRKEIQSSLEAFVKSLYVSECHVRLRISFGELILKDFIMPKINPFPFHDFLVLLQNRRTVLSDPIWRGQQSALSMLDEKLASMEQLQYPRQSYKQIFDFKGTDTGNRLRLEIEMEPGYDAGEVQKCGQKWLKFKTHGQNANILGLKVFDFDKPGFMIRADAYELFTNETMIRDMEAFQSAVSYKPSQDGIGAFPKMKSVFPGHPTLIAVTECTSIKYQYKDTDGIFELRREDIYVQDPGPPSKIPHNTRFEIVYYYPEWDNLLGELSNIKPGEDVGWPRELSTFFPTHIDADHPRSLPKGFKTFMRELYEIQDLLKGVISDLS